MSSPATRPPWRPLTLTYELADDLATDVAAGEPMEASARKRGIPDSSLYRWLQIGRDHADADHAGTPVATDETVAICRYFWDAILRARGQMEAEQARTAALATRSGEKADDIRSRSALALLSRHPVTRDRWGQKVQLEHSGTTTQRTLQVSLTAEQANQLYYAGLDAGALPPPDAAV